VIGLIQRIPAGVAPRRWIAIACTIAAGVLFAAEAPPLQQKPRLGADVVAETILARSDFAGATLLVSSKRDGEGVFIAEIAMREERPGHRVLRASKVLSQAHWDGSGYHLLHTTLDQVSRYLETERVAVLVLDTTPPLFENVPHHDLLLDVVRTYPERWRVLTFPRSAESRYQLFQTSH
jgi:hypothetical protein